MKPRIVFVDDEQRVLEGLRRMLSSMDDEWDMTFLDSPETLLEHMAAGVYDGVVSDLKMPGINGFELLEELCGSEKTKDVPVVILTGAGEDDLKRLEEWHGSRS